MSHASFCKLSATPEIYTLSLHDALPISTSCRRSPVPPAPPTPASTSRAARPESTPSTCAISARSEEHTSELQSRRDLVCRLLLEKKNLLIYEPMRKLARVNELSHTLKSI